MTTHLTDGRIRAIADSLWPSSPIANVHSYPVEFARAIIAELEAPAPIVNPLIEAAQNFDCSPLSADSVEVLLEQYGLGMPRLVGHGFVQAVARLALAQQGNDSKRLDYLQQGVTVELVPGRGDGFRFQIGGLRRSNHDCLRQAIDTAMVIEGKQP